MVMQGGNVLPLHFTIFIRDKVEPCLRGKLFNLAVIPL